ncbi:MAG: SAM-dependent methyltransferase [Alphaproteobacteria bacterium]|nr:SAM-dependent methyltransferase [Alphaproteobacteria bacterium]
MNLTLKAIGFVRGGRTEVVDDDWDAVQAEIVLDPEHFTAEALIGLETFSHVEVLFHFHKGDPAEIVTGARHPRGREDWPKVGIFAQRGSMRPNLLGMTICHVLCVEGATLRVQGLDAIDGTPVLDIKPVLTGFAPRGTVREPEWAVEIMAEYW